MARRRRPLRAVTLVFGSFVVLVLLSQLSAHYFAQAIPKDLVSKNQAALSSIQGSSTEMAVVSSLLGLTFAFAVLVITREVVAVDIDIYRATGLPEGSAFFRILRSHSAGPLAWVAAAGVLAALVDAGFGLNPLIPVGLAVSFAALLVVWLGFLTSVSFSHRDFEVGPGGKAG